MTLPSLAESNALQQLRRCNRDLVALTALSRTWAGKDLDSVAVSLADALHRTLQADLVCVRLVGENPASVHEALRLREGNGAPRESPEVIEAVCSGSEGSRSSGTAWITHRTGCEPLRARCVGLGPEGELGTIIAASQNAAFPTETDCLIMEAAANQAALTVQHARLLREREQAESAARSAEQKLRDLLENASISMHWVGPDGTILWANQAELDLLGYSAEEYVGRGIAEFHADQGVVEDVLTRLKRGETLRDYEARLRRKDGAVLDVVINSNVLWENGEFVHTRCFTRDITDRKRAEEALRCRTEQFEALLNGAPVGVYLVDADLRIREINPVALPSFGEVPGGLIGRDLAEIVHELWDPEYADEIVQTFRRTLETGEPFVAAERATFRADRGVTEYHEWRLQRMMLPDGRYGVVCYFRDITRHVEARQALERAEQQSRRAAEGMRDIAARAHCLLWYAEVEDRGERALHWSLRVADEEAARRFLPVEIPPGYAYGRALSDARLPEDRARMAWGDDEVRAGRSYRQEFRVRDINGAIRWLAEDVQIEPVGPNRWHAVGVCVDITDRKHAEEERERHLAEIELLNSRLKRAMAETHHRVKNNLQVITALVDMGTLAHGPEVPVRELTRIGQHIRSLAAIHDLLTRQAKANEQADHISTADAMNQLAPLVQAVVGHRPVRFQVEGFPVPQRQATSLAILINELVSNAAKHGRGPIDVRLAAADRRAVLEVCDDGPGFPEGFDPRLAANTGLELIENLSRWDLQGAVSYENRPEGGARIVVEFPIASASPNSVERDSESGPSS